MFSRFLLGRQTLAQVKRCKSSAAAIKPQVIFNRTEKQAKFTEGSDYHGFICTRTEFVPDFNMTAYMFRHETTGTEYLHIDRADSNNIFSINFRTTPFNSSGLPHILEHTVLCGSEKFPVRDPFFKMLTRSLATFMNAMTGPDYTIYPFSSMNETDFRHLQKIYLDAVFRPNLKYLDFKQEGWRLEHSELGNRESDFVLKGVVYNEMKGAFSENASVFGQRFLNEILPGHTYRYVSGGDPLHIPQLTHEDLVNFHRKYYHPSNARFFSYGNFSADKSMAYINEQYLAHGKKIDSTYSQVPRQERWTEPREAHITCRYDSLGGPFERQNQIAIGYLMSDITNSYETLLLYVLSELLVRGPNSYFYRSLIEPNISGGFNALTGFDSQLRDTMFVVGLQDLDAGDFQRVREIFDRTIDEAIEKGFEAKHVESVLHNIELLLRHQTPKFGLGLLFNISPLWNHNGDVISYLQVSTTMKQLRENLKDPQYLQRSVEHFFRNNKHRLTMTMSPDREFEMKFSQQEGEVLKEKVAQLTPEDKVKIFAEGLELEKCQKRVEDANILPCLTISDIPKTIERTRVEKMIITGTPTHLITADTNGVTYFRGIFSAAHLSDQERLLLPLLLDVIDQFGTTHQSYRDFDQRIKSKTNGLSFRLHCSENPLDLGSFELGVEFGTFCLDQNSHDMFNIFQDLFHNFQFTDVKRFRMLLENYMSNLVVGIPTSGHLYAMQGASGLVSQAANLRENLSGIGHIDYMKQLMATQKPEEILAKIAKVARKLLRDNEMRCSVNFSESHRGQLLDQYVTFIENLPLKEAKSPGLTSDTIASANRHIAMNIPVNYCAKSLATVPYVHPDFAPLRILAKWISSKYLLPVVREQNGAYGAGAKLGIDGNFCFFSYRDPNCRKTLDTFDGTYEWIRANEKSLDEQQLFEAKLGVIQQLDAPTAAGEKGAEDFKYGITHEIFEEHRSHILTVTKDEVMSMCEKYFAADPNRGVGRCVLGPGEESLQKDGETWSVSKEE
uniref:Presequence protease, mitochondrial n=1 Tax=Lutzomyia longipalpis TaxID=7200 RepID=A0A7G3AJ21_LUTLO